MRSAHHKLYFMTPSSTWKARRLAHTPQVRLALCTFQGKVLSPPAEGTARRLAGPEAKRGRKLICVGPYGFLMNLFFQVRYPGDKTAVHEVSLLAEREREAGNAHGSEAVFAQTQQE
jgi:PPOX class probable F420-dependent enzyme